MKAYPCLVLLAVGLTPLAFSQGEAGFIEATPVFANITVDGNVSDWEGIEPAYVDDIGDNAGSYFDYAAAYLANNNNYLFIRITFASEAPYGDYAYMTNIVFNTDLDRATGYGFAGLTGSEFFIQAGGVYDQRSGQNFVDVYEQTAENNYGAFAFADVAPFDNTTEVEIRLRRDLTFSNDANGMPGLLNPDNAPLFEYPDFMILFEAETPEFSGVEFMPNADPAGGETGIYYTFAEGTGVEAWPLY
ncbi:MAG TPA: hypothetical protein PK878_14695 [bacterium]|nr:hypothetical protein [Candidatus Omnitrophota bacterium]HOJ61528.1 hypothetical protein [bacterium]HPP00573.1 hypothetical protein [bacterium]HXK95653.1 hypothetical protein [bacterium]